MSKFIQSKKKDGKTLKLTFQSEEMDPALVNALRRVLISEVPAYSLAGDLQIQANSSIFNDEYLLQRFYLLPIYAEEPPAEDLVFRICDPNDPSKPLKNENNRDLEIGAHDLQVFDSSGNRAKRDIKSLILNNYPLLKLRKGQEFQFQGQAKLGRGYQHTTFKAVGIQYKFENNVSLGKTNRPAHPITGRPIETIIDKRDFPTDQWENPQIISLTIEENGHYLPETAFKMALDVLEEKIRIFNNLLVQKEAERIEILEQSNIENYVQIKIKDPDDIVEHPLATHTMGNLLAEHMFYHLHQMVKGDLNKILQANTSYKPPHPLDKIIYLNIKTPPELYKKAEQRLPGLQLLEETTDQLVKYLQQLRKEFGK